MAQEADTHTTRGRTMVADFDSLRQRLLFESVGHEEAWARLSAQLRTADLLSNELIITDTQLLDGVFFLLLGPDGFADLLCRPSREPLPLIITARSEDLGAALAEMRQDREFTWSSDAALASTGVVSPRHSGGDDLAARRAAWVRAAHDGRIRVEEYRRDEFPIEQELARSLPPSELSTDLLSRLRTTRKRSEAIRLIDADIREPSQASHVHWWWDQAYASALAMQHGATWLAFGPQEQGLTGQARSLSFLERIQRASSGVVARLNGLRGGTAARDSLRDLRLDGSMIATLAEMPPSVFSLVSHRARASTERWTAHRDPRALLTLAMVVRDVGSQSESWLSRYLSTLGRVAALVAALLLTLLTIFDDGFDSLIVVSVVIALLSGFPVADIRSLIDDSPTRLQGVIHVPKEERK